MEGYAQVDSQAKYSLNKVVVVKDESMEKLVEWGFPSWMHDKSVVTTKIEIWRGNLSNLR